MFNNFSFIEKLSHSDHSWQTNVQGLRGIAIIAVLLFHLWSRRFSQGYLGVDIFFVISGYLMCLLLSAKAPFTLNSTSQFYFRRVRRIIPTYLFVIFSCLIAALLLISPTDYRDLRAEVVKPLFYLSNWPNTPDDDYFAQTAGGYSFFMHLWSLSVELQFYLFVPFLVFALHRMIVSLQLVTILTLAVLSFWFQFTASKDVEHMSLFGRVWQFMFGFLAWHLQQFSRSENTFLTNTKSEKQPTSQIQTRFDRWNSLLDKVLNTLFPLVLILLLLVPLTPYRRLNRFLVIFIVSLTIGLNSDTRLLSNSILVWIGNISYSVYLIHWPLFEWWRYEFEGTQENTEQFTWIVGVLLITISVLFGNVVEELFKRVGTFLGNWRNLLVLIGFLYLAIGLTVWTLEMNELDFSINPKPRRYQQELCTQLKAIEFFENRNRTIESNPKELLKYGRDFAETALSRWYCNKSIKIPTTFNETKLMRKFVKKRCTVADGTGHKTVVVLGNSHARCYMPGIMHSFRNVYSNITLIYQDGCRLIGGDMNEVGPVTDCFNERAAYLPMLQQWKYPIDILIIGQTESAPEEGRQKNYAEDPVYKAIEQELAALSQVVREVIILPNVHFDHKIDSYMNKWKRRIAKGSSLSIFRIPIERAESNHPRSREHFTNIQCAKCAKVKWEDLWCNRTAGTCDSVDPISHLPFFYDWHHPNYFGSMFVGQFLRQRYDQWTTEHKTATR